VTEATFEVDLTTITTNESRRDDRVQDALETGEFPTATFTLTEPIELGDGAGSGEAVSVTAVGDLMIHGVTESVEFPMEAQLVDDTVVLVGSIDRALSDFDVEAPESPVVLSVSDDFTLELQLLLTR
jgi:polyisoprenoid-binding protein YceI